MCGICGFVSDSAPPEADVVDRMARTLAARGPDDSARFVDDRAALGHRRLSIIDLEGGRQPMTNEDQSVWVVANGEIYNFPDLRRSLEAKGHRFQTRSDTEVLLHLYEERGERLLEDVNGMFALALWDRKRRKLLLARDRMGQKPLYYAPLPAGGFAFASELKALRMHPGLDWQIDPASLARFLLHQYIPAPFTIYRGVYKLDRSQGLVYENGRVRTWQYWQPTVAEPGQPGLPLGQAAQELWRQLRDSVQRRLISDVPLGVFLSGGIDSSSLVACMSELLPPERINTFTIGFREPSYDESHAARMVARYYGTSHHERAFQGDDMVDVLPTVADYLDEPFADPSILPTYLLCRFAREHVKVALGGDGGDELLGGYPTFMATRSLRWFRRLPGWGRLALTRFVDRLPVSHRNMSVDFLLREYLRGAGTEDAVANHIWMGAFTPAEQRDLLHPEVRHQLANFDLSDELLDRYARAIGNGPIGKMLDLYSQTYLQEGVLAKVDRASMAHGLEVRAPFLDPELMGFVGRLPTRHKVRGLETKRVLKRAVLGRLPRWIVRRKKHGFGIPVAAWLNDNLREMVGDLLAPSRLQAQGLFNPAVVGRLVDEHRSRQRNHRKPLWTLLMFQLWYDRFAAQPTEHPAVQPADRPRDPQPEAAEL